MGWAIEFIIDWIWTDCLYAIYKRYGWVVATLLFLAPFLLIGLIILFIVSV